MKRYQTILILTLLLFCTLVGCGKQETKPSAPESTKPEQTTESVPYEVKTETFQEKEITIHYPQLVNLPDRTAEDKINSILKENALSDYNGLLKQEEEDVTYELKDTVTYSSPTLLSVRYQGYLSYPESAHPSNFVKTISIDIPNQTIIKLRDLVKLNADFVTSLQNGTYKANDTEQTPELLEAIQNQWQERDQSAWIEYLKNADEVDINHEGAASYLTKDALVVVIPVPHYMGDYAEFELKDLSANQIAENGRWNPAAND